MGGTTSIHCIRLPIPFWRKKPLREAATSKSRDFPELNDMESNWWQRLRFLSLALLPKKNFSRLCGWIADQRWPSYPLHQILIRSFVRYFNVDLSECPQKLKDFQTFNEF